MKFCATCGEILNDSSEEFSINGILQCEKCAYPDHEPIITDFDGTKSYQKSQNNFWAKILKTVGSINIFVGIIISLVLAVLYSSETDSVFTAIIIFIAGTILSVITSSLLMAFAQLAEDVSAIRCLKECESQINK